MVCDKVLIHDYIDERLGQEEKEKLEMHIAQCEQCRIYYQELQNTVTKLNTLKKFSVPDNFIPSLMERIDNDRKILHLQYRILKWGLACAAVFLMVFTIIDKNLLPILQQKKMISKAQAPTRKKAAESPQVMTKVKKTKSKKEKTIIKKPAKTIIKRQEEPKEECTMDKTKTNKQINAECLDDEDSNWDTEYKKSDAHSQKEQEKKRE